MYNIDEYRKTIDEIDTEMRRLFVRRMETAEAIAREKWANSVPIFQPDREKVVIEKNSEGVEEYLRPLYEKFMRNILDLSKEHQLDTIRDL